MGLRLRIKSRHAVNIGKSIVRNEISKAGCELEIISPERIERDDRRAAPKSDLDTGWGEKC